MNTTDNTDKVILYGLTISVYTRIVRLVLEEKGVPYTLREVNPFADKGVPPWYPALQPFGRIPALAHGPFQLYETAAIGRYIDEAFPGPALQPADAQGRARMQQTISVMDAYGYRPLIWPVVVERISVPHHGGTPDEAAISAALPDAARCLDVLDTMLGEQRYLAGPMLSLADLHAAPMLIYFALTPEGKQLLAERPRLARWLDTIKTRPSIMGTRATYDR